MTYAPTRARVLLAPPDAPAGGSCAALLAVTPGSRVRVGARESGRAPRAHNAQDRRLGRLVALKFLIASLRNGPHVAACFEATRSRPPSTLSN